MTKNSSNSPAPSPKANSGKKQPQNGKAGGSGSPKAVNKSNSSLTNGTSSVTTNTNSLAMSAGAYSSTSDPQQNGSGKNKGKNGNNHKHIQYQSSGSGLTTKSFDTATGPSGSLSGHQRHHQNAKNNKGQGASPAPSPSNSNSKQNQKGSQNTLSTATNSGKGRSKNQHVPPAASPTAKLRPSRTMPQEEEEMEHQKEKKMIKAQNKRGSMPVPGEERYNNEGDVSSTSDYEQDAHNNNSKMTHLNKSAQLDQQDKQNQEALYELELAEYKAPMYQSNVDFTKTAPVSRAVRRQDSAGADLHNSNNSSGSSSKQRNANASNSKQKKAYSKAKSFHYSSQYTPGTLPATPSVTFPQTPSPNAASLHPLVMIPELGVVNMLNRGGSDPTQSPTYQTPNLTTTTAAIYSQYGVHPHPHHQPQTTTNASATQHANIFHGMSPTHHITHSHPVTSAPGLTSEKLINLANLASRGSQESLTGVTVPGVGSNSLGQLQHPSIVPAYSYNSQLYNTGVQSVSSSVSAGQSQQLGTLGLANGAIYNAYGNAHALGVDVSSLGVGLGSVGTLSLPFSTDPLTQSTLNLNLNNALQLQQGSQNGAWTQQIYFGEDGQQINIQQGTTWQPGQEFQSQLQYYDSNLNQIQQAQQAQQQIVVSGLSNSATTNNSASVSYSGSTTATEPKESDNVLSLPVGIEQIAQGVKKNLSKQNIKSSNINRGHVTMELVRQVAQPHFDNMLKELHAKVTQSLTQDKNQSSIVSPFGPATPSTSQQQLGNVLATIRENSKVEKGLSANTPFTSLFTASNPNSSQSQSSEQGTHRSKTPSHSNTSGPNSKIVTPADTPHQSPKQSQTKQGQNQKEKDSHSKKVLNVQTSRLSQLDNEALESALSIKERNNNGSPPPPPHLVQQQDQQQQVAIAHHVRNPKTGVVSVYYANKDGVISSTMSSPAPNAMIPGSAQYQQVQAQVQAQQQAAQQQAQYYQQQGQYYNTSAAAQAQGQAGQQVQPNGKQRTVGVPYHIYSFTPPATMMRPNHQGPLLNLPSAGKAYQTGNAAHKNQNQKSSRADSVDNYIKNHNYNQQYDGEVRDRSGSVSQFSNSSRSKGSSKGDRNKHKVASWKDYESLNKDKTLEHHQKYKSSNENSEVNSEINQSKASKELQISEETQDADISITNESSQKEKKNTDNSVNTNRTTPKNKSHQDAKKQTALRNKGSTSPDAMVLLTSFDDSMNAAMNDDAVKANDKDKINTLNIVTESQQSKDGTQTAGTVVTSGSATLKLPEGPTTTGGTESNTNSILGSEICRHWLTKGKCKVGDACLFSHDPAYQNVEPAEQKKKKKKKNKKSSQNGLMNMNATNGVSAVEQQLQQSAQQMAAGAGNGSMGLQQQQFQQQQYNRGNSQSQQMGAQYAVPMQQQQQLQQRWSNSNNNSIGIMGNQFQQVHQHPPPPPPPMSQYASTQQQYQNFSNNNQYNSNNISKGSNQIQNQIKNTGGAAQRQPSPYSKLNPPHPNEKSTIANGGKGGSIQTNSKGQDQYNNSDYNNGNNFSGRMGKFTGNLVGSGGNGN